MSTIAQRILCTKDMDVLLPENCKGPSGAYTVEQLRAILADDSLSLLITGDTGTGKEALAECVFKLTGRDRKKGQSINCAGLDPNLIGSELFGHKKGSFTGATEDRNGLLKRCDGGVLFLDEIGWLPKDLQARLLRFMETGEIRRIGDDEVQKGTNVRVIAATNCKRRSKSVAGSWM